MGPTWSKKEDADEDWLGDDAAAQLRRDCAPASGVLRWAVRLSDWQPDGTEAADSRADRRTLLSYF